MLSDDVMRAAFEDGNLTFDTSERLIATSADGQRSVTFKPRAWTEPVHGRWKLTSIAHQRPRRQPGFPPEVSLRNFGPEHLTEIRVDQDRIIFTDPCFSGDVPIESRRRGRFFVGWGEWVENRCGSDKLTSLQVMQYLQTTFRRQILWFDIDWTKPAQRFSLTGRGLDTTTVLGFERLSGP